MKQQTFNVTIVDKYRHEVGWIFKSVEYVLVMRFEIDGQVKERKVSVQTHHDFEQGEKTAVFMYSKDGHTWFFSEQEAALS